jgi:hypothetical protein
VLGPDGPVGPLPMLLSVFFFFFRIHFCGPRGTEPHVALPVQIVSTLLLLPLNASFHFQFLTPIAFGHRYATFTLSGFDVRS